MKVKNLISTLKEKAFKMDLAYEEWLRDFINAPNEKELDKMEEDFKTSTNNPNYQPVKEHK